MRTMPRSFARASSRETLACDTFANNDNTALDTNSDAIAYATLQYAMSTADINDAKAKGNFKLNVPFPLPPNQ